VKRLLIAILAVGAVGASTWLVVRHTRQESPVAPTYPAPAETVRGPGDYGTVYAGVPTGRDVTVLPNRGFTVGYSEKRRTPLWVAYRIFQMEAPEAGDRPGNFRIDRRTQAKVSPDDYTRSGYDRGHMAPNWAIATRYGRDGQRASFLMSNVCPQKPTLNQQIWKRLEKRVGKTYANRLEEVWILTGPIFDDRIEKLPSGVEIPDAFFKIVVDEIDGRPRALTFVIPQDVDGGERIQQFLTSIDAVEAATGLDFLRDLPDGLEDRLEQQEPQSLW
jgi:endonuclease G